MSHHLTLSRSQAERLATSCAAYRSYAWQMLDPSEERNRVMQVAQAMQGRLCERQTGGTELFLVVSDAERQACQMILTTLLRVYGAEPSYNGRDRLLGDLAALRALFQRSQAHVF